MTELTPEQQQAVDALRQKMEGDVSAYLSDLSRPLVSWESVKDTPFFPQPIVDRAIARMKAERQRREAEED